MYCEQNPEEILFIILTTMVQMFSLKTTDTLFYLVRNSVRQLDQLSCPSVIHSLGKCQGQKQMRWTAGGMKKSQAVRLMDRETKEHLLR